MNKSGVMKLLIIIVSLCVLAGVSVGVYSLMKDPNTTDELSTVTSSSFEQTSTQESEAPTNTSIALTKPSDTTIAETTIPETTPSETIAETSAETTGTVQTTVKPTTGPTTPEETATPKPSATPKPTVPSETTTATTTAPTVTLTASEVIA